MSKFVPSTKISARSSRGAAGADTMVGATTGVASGTGRDWGNDRGGGLNGRNDEGGRGPAKPDAAPYHYTARYPEGSEQPLYP